MIKLTTLDGDPFWANPSLMTSMFPKSESTTTICFIFPEDTVTVKETPEEINQAIERHTLKEIRYREKLANLVYGYSSGKEPVTTSLDSKHPAELDFDAKGEVRGISSDCAIVREYEIWSEGYAATGERGYAFFHGKMTGKSFNEACIRFFEMKDSDFRNGMDAENAELFDAEQLTYWGCRLFPTEAEARKSFG